MVQTSNASWYVFIIFLPPPPQSSAHAGLLFVFFPFPLLLKCISCRFYMCFTLLPASRFAPKWTSFAPKISSKNSCSNFSRWILQVHLHLPYTNLLIYQNDGSVHMVSINSLNQQYHVSRRMKPFLQAKIWNIPHSHNDGLLGNIKTM